MQHFHGRRRAAVSTGRCIGGILCLIDFLADARNLPPVAQRFVNVAAARLAATPGTNRAKLR